MNKLRPYQEEMIQQVKKAWKDKFKRPCIVLPCGAGKSVIVAEMAKKTTDNHKRVLFLVHRKELCEQIEETFKSWGVDMRYCYVGMVQTVTRRLKKMIKPDLIITDENHHCLAKSYQNIYNYFKDTPCVGVTATPVRLNGTGLFDVNDKLIIGVSTKWLIANNHLAPYDYYSPSVADLTGLHTKNGEYMASEITEKLDSKKIYGDVVSYYEKLAKGKQAICYCAGISTSKKVADEFTANGVRAAHIDGETPKLIRSSVIDDFRKGRIKILCNVDLISEGFDVPDCEVSILLRPTQSLTLFIQQSMRCMRYKPDKKAIIIDHVGNYARFGLPDTQREWKLDSKKTINKKNEDAQEKVRQCPECLYTHEYGPVCINCGYVYPIKERTVQEVQEAKLEKIESFVLDYSSADECSSLVELMLFAKKKGYKPGWAYYQARLRGFAS